GTLTFGGRFATNPAITRALEAFAHGYVHCLPRGSHARIVLARGTSNYPPHVPSGYLAGRKWARETVAFARFLRRAGLGPRLHPHVRLLPRLPRVPAGLRALQLRLARRRRRRDLERASALVRQRRDALRAADPRDLLPGDGGAMGRAQPDRGRALRPRAPLRRAD